MHSWGQGGRNFAAFVVYRELRELGARVHVRHDGVIRVTIWTGKSRLWTFVLGWILRRKASRMAHLVVEKAKAWAPIQVVMKSGSGK